jgi:endoribonuclease Dicer
MLSYLHCKSAALKHFVHLVESGNDAHRNILTKLSLPDPTLRSWTISFLTNIAGAIPPVALHEDNPADVYLSEGESRLVDPVAGGIISEASSLRVIYQYAASLPNHTVDRDRPFFEYQESISTNGETYFKCSIHFPSSSTVGVVAGEPHLSRARARRSACYQACTKLFKKGLLDYTLYPRHHFDKSEFGRTYTPDGGVASNSSTYLRRRPRFWMSSFAEGSLKQLYPTIICLEDIDSAPIVLLTRLPLPEFAPFNVFEGGNVISVGLRRIQLPIHVDEDQIELLRRYTVRACRAMTNKRFVSKLEETVYFFAPLDGRNLSAADDPRALRIAWDYVRLAADGWARPFDLARIEEETKDAVIQDKAVEFTRRFFVSELMRELNPLSKPIEGSVGYFFFVLPWLFLTIDNSGKQVMLAMPNFAEKGHNAMMSLLTSSSHFYV